MAQKYGILIAGRWETTKKELEVKSPYDGTTVGVVCMAGPEELDRAAAAADKAFKELKKMPAYRKAEIIGKVVEGLKEREEELARTISLEAGKPIRDARTEVKRAQNTFQLALEEAKRINGEIIPLDIMAGSEGRFGLVRRFPVGPVLGISPFNFPLNLVAHKVAPAMACGNSIIVKPASKTPLSALKLGEIVLEAGWPEGGLNITPSSGEDAEKLLDDDRIKKLTFTGSAAVGWRLKARAGTRKVTLELGGNAGVIVRHDSDLDFAAKRCALGSFSYAGQICISVQRIYIERSVFDEFRERFIGCCKKLRLGDPLDETTDIGPMIEEGALERTEKWVEEAVKDGAELIIGGKRRERFFEPTVLTSTKPQMKVCSEEVFAPVVTVEPYDTFEEALTLVNRSRYGLQAGVFTRDMRNIILAFDELEVGGVVVNDIPTYRVDSMPYGGIKMSGFGREGIRYAIEEMTELKLLAVNPG